MVVTATASHRASPEMPAPPLLGGARVDVCIVGASLAGMLAAYLLARDKRTVMVVDDGPIGGAPGVADAAHLASVLEQPYRHLERRHGAAAARLAAQGYGAAVDAIESIVRRERIACEFERLDGYAFAGPGGDRGAPQAEVASALRAGVRDVEYLATPPIDGGGDRACVRYGGQAQFHPGKFLDGLARAIAREGGRIHCGVRTRPLHPDEPTTLVTSGGHRIQSDIVVTQGAERAAPRAVNVVGLRIARGAAMRALYWDCDGPAPRCVRLRTHGRGPGEVLLAAGEEAPEVLADWARRLFPRAGEVVQQGRAERARAADLFACSGAAASDADSVYVSTASWGTPMTRAAVAGIAIRDFAASCGLPGGDLYLPSACYAGRFEPTPNRGQTTVITG